MNMPVLKFKKISRINMTSIIISRMNKNSENLTSKDILAGSEIL